MKHEHIIEFVGGAEEDVAYLRLLLRKAARQLTYKWRLRGEEDKHVDMLVVEDIGDSASIPGADPSQRRMRIINPALGAAGMETVPWPLAQDTLTRLLNFVPTPAPVVAAPEPVAAPAPVAPIGLSGLIQHNIYDDLFEPEDVDPSEAGHDIVGGVDFGEWVPPARHNESALMQEAEQFFRADSRTEHVEALRAIRLHAADLEATEGHTSGSGSRKDRRGLIEMSADTPHSLSVVEANARYPLATYLTGRLLPGPSRIEAAEIVLTLDPRNRLYYAKGGLILFEECCKQKLRRGDWRQLASSEFVEVKQQIEGRPYAQLLWLSAYFDDVAAQEPDEILRYRILQNIDLQGHYPGAARVAEVLLKGAGLKSAAATAGVSLAEAKRVAAAFDAAGLLVPE